MPEFVTAAEAAEVLGCSDTQIRRRIKAGKLPATKKGGEWRIRRDYLDGITVADVRPTDRQTAAATDEQTDRQTAAPTDEQTDLRGDRQTDSPTDRPTSPPAWRDDLLAQVARLEANEDRLRQEHAQREERSKARIIDLERDATTRESRVADMQAEREDVIADLRREHVAEVAALRGQVSVLEAKVRETLEERADENKELALRIADIVEAHTEMQTRVVELQPVADRVPVLVAAVEEKDASLSDRDRELGNMRADIDAIASRPVTGPVFRLLTKGKLRR
jgi:excisionase family DNA binding protein